MKSRARRVPARYRRHSLRNERKINGQYYLRDYVEFKELENNYTSLPQYPTTKVLRTKTEATKKLCIFCSNRSIVDLWIDTDEG